MGGTLALGGDCDCAVVKGSIGGTGSWRDEVERGRLEVGVETEDFTSLSTACAQVYGKTEQSQHEASLASLAKPSQR